MVCRLVTFVDVDDDSGGDTISFSVLQVAGLADGGRVVLLDDRGWGESGPPNISAHTSIQDIVDTARTVVGPDEPHDGLSWEDMEADHWFALQQVAGHQALAIDAGTLKQLPHDVLLSARLQRRAGE